MSPAQIYLARWEGREGSGNSKISVDSTQYIYVCLSAHGMQFLKLSDEVQIDWGKV